MALSTDFCFITMYISMFWFFRLQIAHTLLSMFCEWFVTIWKSSFSQTPVLRRNIYCL